MVLRISQDICHVRMTDIEGFLTIYGDSDNLLNNKMSRKVMGGVGKKPKNKVMLGKMSEKKFMQDKMSEKKIHAQDGPHFDLKP